jgi:hypothetical protein
VARGVRSPSNPFSWSFSMPATKPTVKRTTYLGIQSNSLKDMVKMYWDNLERCLREYWGERAIGSFNHENGKNGRGFRVHITTGYNMENREDVSYMFSILQKDGNIRIVCSYHEGKDDKTWASGTFDYGTDIGTLVEATDLLCIEAYKAAGQEYEVA